MPVPWRGFDFATIEALSFRSNNIGFHNQTNVMSLFVVYRFPLFEISEVCKIAPVVVEFQWNIWRKSTKGVSG